MAGHLPSPFSPAAQLRHSQIRTASARRGFRRLVDRSAQRVRVERRPGHELRILALPRADELCRINHLHTGHLAGAQDQLVRVEAGRRSDEEVDILVLVAFERAVLGGDAAHRRRESAHEARLQLGEADSKAELLSDSNRSMGRPGFMRSIQQLIVTIP
eukprot:6210176-Pleurochrysis_carterae.AAC.2